MPYAHIASLARNYNQKFSPKLGRSTNLDFANFEFSIYSESMAQTKVVFIAFAKEDEGLRNLFSGQRVHPDSPFEFTDMSVKEPYDSGWKERTATRIRRSDGVIALISSSTPTADGQLWEISSAVEEDKPLLGIWLEDDYRIEPPEMDGAPCQEWTWEHVADFIDSL